MSDPLAEAAARVPALAQYTSGTFDVPAVVLRDPDWLAARIAETGRRWRGSNATVDTTLWWYSTSSTMVFPVMATAMIGGRVLDPRLERSTCFVGTGGDLGGIRGGEAIALDDAVAPLTEALRAVIEALAEVSAVRTRSLWALTTDSIANRCLDVGAALGDRALGSAFSEDLIAKMDAPLPAPRFVDVDGRRFTKRCSCCLLYITEGADMCTSCPRRTPSDRLRRLVVAARY